VCLAPANTVAYPNGAGHLWVYLHWALALKALGCRVIWLEGIDVDDSDTSPAGRRRRRGGRAVDCVATLKTRLEPYGLADTLALYALNGAAAPEDVAQGSLDVDAAAGAARHLLHDRRDGGSAGRAVPRRRPCLAVHAPSHLPAGVARAAAQRARPVHHGGSLVGRDVRVQRNHLLQRKAGLLSRVSRLADPHARPARAGGLPR